MHGTKVDDLIGNDSASGRRRIVPHLSRTVTGIFSRFRSRPDFVTAFWANEFSDPGRAGQLETAGYQSLHDKVREKLSEKLADSKGCRAANGDPSLPMPQQTEPNHHLHRIWFDGLTSALSNCIIDTTPSTGSYEQTPLLDVIVLPMWSRVSPWRVNRS